MVFILERLAILSIFFIIFIATIAAWRVFLAHRVRRLATEDVPHELRRIAMAGRPALLYFTTASCTQCRFQQSPILNQLAALTNLPIHTLDAVEHERLAHFYGIMTVPTTVILDHNLRPMAINHGLATLPHLQQQAATAGVLSA
jgi:thioredoxin 1